MSTKQFEMTKDAALQAAKDVQSARSYVTAAVGEYTSAVGRAATVAAYATYAAVESGYLQTRKAKGEQHAAGSVSQQEYAALFGKSPTTVALWKNAGRAFVVHGVDPESPLGRDLINGAATPAAVASLIRQDKVSHAALAKAVKQVKMAKDNARRTGDTGKNTRGSGSADESARPVDGWPSNPPRNNTTRIDAIEMLLAAISKPTPGEVERLNGLLERISALLPESESKAA
jgi:hypothetical protein